MRGEGRERLLDAAVTHVLERGDIDMSLRELAQALGTSHRMLVYHFGSRDGLLVAIVTAVQDQVRQVFGEILGEPGRSLADQVSLCWQRCSEPAVLPAISLFFQIYADVLRGREPLNELRGALVEQWVDSLTDIGVARGTAPRVARARARLCLATLRGLLLDLLTTGDRAGVEDALGEFVAYYRSLDRPESTARPASAEGAAAR